MTPSLHSFAQNFIKERFMAVVACVSDGKPRAFTCWYVVHEGKLYWKSRTASIHSRAFEQEPEAALCVYDHGAAYPDDKTGVQVVGTVARVTDRNELAAVIRMFADRFGDAVFAKNNVDDLAAPDTNSTLYAFTPREMKLVAKELDVHLEAYEPFSL